MAEPLGVWVYAVAERDGPSWFGEFAGVGGGQVRADFRAALRRITARKEWGVKAYAARPPAPDETPVPRRAEAPASQASPAGAGAAYLQRRRDQLSAGKTARSQAIASAQTVHDALSRLAAETRLHPPQAAQLSGNKAHMLLNAAYLLEDRRADEFASMVATLVEQHPAIRLELTGPWPPYSFVGLESGGRQ